MQEVNYIIFMINLQIINIPPPVKLTNYYIHGSMKMKDQFHKYHIPFLN